MFCSPGNSIFLYIKWIAGYTTWLNSSRLLLFLIIFSVTRVCETLQLCYAISLDWIRIFLVQNVSNLYLEGRQRQINMNQINNVLFSINYNEILLKIQLISKKFYLENSQKMITLNKKIIKFLNLMFKQKLVGFS